MLSLEAFANSLNDYFGIYGIRVLVVLCFSFLFFVYLVILKYVRRKKEYLKILFGVSLLSSLLLFVLSIKFFNIPTDSNQLRKLLFAMIPLFLLSLAILPSLFFTFSKKKSKKKKKKNIFLIVSISFLSIAVLSLLFLTLVSFFARPRLVLAGLGANIGSMIEEEGRIYVKLTVPVNKNSIEISIFPEQSINIVYDYVSISKTLIDGFEIVPVENYPAGSKIVVYVTGLSNLLPGGKVHEESLDFFTPDLPNVLGTNMDNLGGDISVESDLEINLDTRDQKSANWALEIVPEVKFKLVREFSDTVKVDFDSLMQGTTYSVKLLRGNKIYRIDTEDEVRIDNQKVVKEFSFKTMDAPGIKGYNWKNTHLPPSEPLVVEFSDNISLDTIQGKYKIEPPIEHSIRLGNSANIFVLSPKGGFQKDTSYNVTFAQGLKTMNGSFFEQDTSLPFKTAGAVYPSYFSPRRGASKISIYTKTLSITFDQAVDKASAESRFSIAPALAGTFTWSGNTMHYNISSQLPYYTQYTMYIGEGVKSIYGLDSNKVFSSTFTTEEQVFLLNVPQYYQPSGFDCNLYTARMALAYRGVGSSVDAMKGAIGIGGDPNVNWVEGYGVHVGPLSKYIAGFRGVSVKRGWSIAGLLQEVVSGNPVIIYEYNSKSQPPGPFILPSGATGYMGMHSEVVVGFTGRVDNPTSILTNDPWRGRRKLTIGAFSSIWGYMNNTAIVVY